MLFDFDGATFSVFTAETISFDKMSIDISDTF